MCKIDRFPYKPLPGSSNNYYPLASQNLLPLCELDCVIAHRGKRTPSRRGPFAAAYGRLLEIGRGEKSAPGQGDGDFHKTCARGSSLKFKIRDPKRHLLTFSFQEMLKFGINSSGHPEVHLARAPHADKPRPVIDFVMMSETLCPNLRRYHYNCIPLDRSRANLNCHSASIKSSLISSHLPRRLFSGISLTASLFNFLCFLFFDAGPLVKPDDPGTGGGDGGACPPAPVGDEEMWWDAERTSDVGLGSRLLWPPPPPMEEEGSWPSRLSRSPSSSLPAKNNKREQVGKK